MYCTVRGMLGKAILSLVPLTNKGAIKRPPLEATFKFRAAAALLYVPEQYARVVTKLSLEVRPRTGAPCVTTTQCSGRSTPSPRNQSPRHLASIGMRAEEAEGWRAWAATYGEMVLEERPDGTHAAELRRAREKAHARIDGDAKWVLKNVHNGLARQLQSSVMWTSNSNAVTRPWKAMMCVWGPPERIHPDSHRRYL
ncbi:hypothetical protein BC826DRAFT_77014 [Russula brevipes]|nr:hypothetical protein BC826DRAFT_77014 [Russula brevipes]